MKKRFTIPSFLALIVLLVSVAIGVFLIQGKRIFRIGATGSFTPKEVRITNNSDNSFTVSWVTDGETLGFISWGKTNSLGSTNSEDGNKKTLHSVDIKGLVSNTLYFFKINSGGSFFDNNGKPWETQTGSRLNIPQGAYVTSGIILDPANQPARNVIVYVSIQGSSVLSTRTTSNGEWVMPLSQLRTQDLTSYFQLTRGSVIDLFIQGGSLSTSWAKVTLEGANPTPQITLGQVYDFQGGTNPVAGGVPESKLEVPPDTSLESKFIIPKNTLPTVGKNVTLDSLEEGENITSKKPEFFGQGSPGTVVNVEVESELQSTSIKVDSTGKWKWNPPKTLEEGEHKIIVTWRDSQGVLRTLTKIFFVTAAEGPAFSASSSGTPTSTPKTTPTPKPEVTSTPTSTSPPRVSLPLTNGETPSSGEPLPTVILLSLASALIISSFLLWKELKFKTQNS